MLTAPMLYKKDKLSDGGENIEAAGHEPDHKPPPDKPQPEPVKEPPGRPGRDVPEPTPIDDPQPPKPKKKALDLRPKQI